MMTQDIIEIPPGILQIGSATVHLNVNVNTFYMDCYPITNAQFKAFVEAEPQWQKDNIEDKFHDGNYLKLWNGTDYPSGKAEHPVVYVSWFSAMAYATWARRRLPTEAEWIHAAHGGQQNLYPWGNAHPTIIAENWHAARLTTHFAREQQRLGPDTEYQESFNGFVQKKPPIVAKRADADTTHIQPRANFFQLFDRTTPVGCFAPNPFHLYDMTGNVWEWCLDEYDAHYQNNDKTIKQLRKKWTRIQTPRNCRGGGWRTPLEDLPLAKAYTASPPTTTDATLGFRCVLS